MAQQFPTSSTTPPAAETPAISAQINVATRLLHTELNRLIVARLPLALPPHSSTPARLGFGLAVFAQIYFAFEREWSELERTAAADIDDGPHAKAINMWLATLRPNGLHRTPRFQADLEHISTVIGVDVLSIMKNLRPITGLPSVKDRSHSLIAYAWVMYMAIFSGGRWIRQQLANPGGDFWTSPSRDQVPKLQDRGRPSRDLPGFTFLFFDGEEDGEDIKALFKARLTDGELLLTMEERQDVVDAAQQLFKHCIALVHELDRLTRRRELLEWMVAGLVSTAIPLALLVLYLCRTFVWLHLTASR